MSNAELVFGKNYEVDALGRPVERGFGNLSHVQKSEADAAVSRPVGKAKATEKADLKTAVDAENKTAAVEVTKTGTKKRSTIEHLKSLVKAAEAELEDI